MLSAGIPLRWGDPLSAATNIEWPASIMEPRVLYRGVLINATSMAPICALQFFVNNLLDRSVRGTASAAQRAGFAAVAGICSSMVSGPAELLMIQQQKSGSSLFLQLKKVTKEYGLLTLTRGLVPTIVRESIYTATYLGVSPILQERILQSTATSMSTIGTGSGHGPKTSSFGQSPILATLVAAVVSGTIASLITQPFDTIKTRMQSNLDLLQYRRMKSTFQAMVGEGGLKVFYSGFIPRAQRVVCGVFILDESRTLLTNFYLKYISR